MIVPAKPRDLSEKRKENLFTAIYIGALFIILAAVYFSHLPSSLWDELVNFFTSLTLSPVPGTRHTVACTLEPCGTWIYISRFSIRHCHWHHRNRNSSSEILLRSPVARKAETVENIVFWLGASFLTIAYLVNMTIAAEWFVFWAGILMLFGLSLITRAFVLLAKR